jgi:hypothetical protein
MTKPCLHCEIAPNVKLALDRGDEPARVAWQLLKAAAEVIASNPPQDGENIETFILAAFRSSYSAAIAARDAGTLQSVTVGTA